MSNTPEADAVWEVLRTIPDPEFGVNIVDLGLIYSVETKGNDIHIVMTLTTPNCPSGEWIFNGVKTAAQGLPNAGEVEVDMVFDPAWTNDMITEEGRAFLNM